MTAGALVTVATAMIAAYAIERDNRPYTGNFVTAEDVAVSAAIFCVPVLGAALLGIRPGHWTGRIMLASGGLLATALLCHGLAVRWVVVDGTSGWFVDVCAWLATALFLPALGLLPFAVATWPDGRIESRLLRMAGYVAAAGLTIASLAQAFTADRLDGVAHGTIPNPYGQEWLRSATDLLTVVGVISVGVFGVWVAVDILIRAVRARGLRRRQLVPVAAVIATALVALVVGFIGGNPFIVLFFLIPLAGVAMVVAAWGRSRLERSERARAGLVRERESERLRVRRDLHDGVGPLLAALRLELDRMVDASRGARARTMLEDAIGEVRRISRDLRPVALDDLGLSGAVRHQALSLAAPGGPSFDVTMPDDLDALPPAVEVAAYRIVAEAMTNVVRHAKAKSCRVSLEIANGVLEISVVDDGIGLRAPGSGAGLPSIRGRADELGGRCSIAAAAKRGTVVRVEIPIGAP
jgi:signal transduction histidine kinase